MRKNYLIKRIVVVGIIILFFGVSVVSGIYNTVEKTEKLNIDIITFTTIDDTFIDQPAGPNLPRGDYEYMIVENAYGASSGWEIDALVKFDLSAFPNNTTISSAKFYLYYYSWYANNPAGRPLNLYRIISSWDEETACWNLQPSYASQPCANSPVPSSTGIWMEWNVTNEVQNIINGQEDFYGWKIVDDNYWGWYDIPQAFFRTKEFDYNFRPYLEIQGDNLPNIPPFEPSDPDPEDGAILVNTDTILSWNCDDPNGDPLTYDVYFGNTTSPSKIVSNQSDTVYNPGTLDYGTTYYWKIVAWDNLNVSTSGPLWEFTTEYPQKLTFHPTDDTFIDQPAGPDLPRGDYEYMIVENKYGADGSFYEIDVLIKFNVSPIPTNATISLVKLKLYYYMWYANNPSGRDLNLYRITNNWNEETVTWNTQPSYASQPSASSSVPLSTDIWMEWDVTKDVQDFIDGLQVNCGWKVTDENYWGWFDIPQAFFRTKEFSYSLGPLITGTASGKPGESYVYSIVSNDPEGLELFYYIEWGDGNNSGWKGPYDSGEEATLEHTWSERGDYKIRAKAKDTLGEESDWGYLEVSMPMNQQLHNWWFLQFLQNHPRMFPILRQVLGLK
jgi:hypothetical protein